MGKGRKKKLMKKVGCYFSAFAISTLVCAGCKKGMDDGMPPEGDVTGIPSQSVGETGDSAQPAGETTSPTATAGTKASPQPVEETGTPSQPTAGTTNQAQPTGTASKNTTANQQGLVTVTPVPEAAVKNIAGSMSANDYPVVDGSTATLPLSQALYSLATGADAKAAEKAIVHTKTTNSYYRLYDGEADLLIVYEPTEEIITRMQTENLLVKPIGLDALVFMANEGNPVQSLTKQQLVDIYAGKIENWKAVGGKDAELLAFQRPQGSGSQTLMQKLVMGSTPMEECDNSFQFLTMAGILDGMRGYDGSANALGYSVFYYASAMYSQPGIRFMGVDGVMPSMQTIHDGSYPFVNAFYAVIRPDEPEGSNARILFDWLTGKEGQQLVLDLGYVPVDMPEGGLLTEKDGAAGSLELTPVKKLAPGEHYIFVQKEPPPTNNSYGDVWIFDEDWNCMASFQSAIASADGITDARYIEIYRFWEEKEDSTAKRLYIYDLLEGEFIDFESSISGSVSILDNKRGYFEQYNYIDGIMQVIDRDGNVLVENIPMLEETGRLMEHGNCYMATYYENDLAEAPGGCYKIYDPDFHLKAIVYSEKEDMPPEGERLKGVDYVYDRSGFVLSEDGEVLLTGEKFLEVFGNGTDTECKIGNGYYDEHWNGTMESLYEVTYAGETWYVDAALTVYMKEGDEALTFLDKERAGEKYYRVWLSKWMKDEYFAPDGSLLRAKAFEGEPDVVEVHKDGSYLLAKSFRDQCDLELVVPQDGFYHAYHYEMPGAKYVKAEYLESYMVSLWGKYEDGDGEKWGKLQIYKNDELIQEFSDSYVAIEQLGNRRTGQRQREDGWLVTMQDKKERILAEEEGAQHYYTYAVMMDGMVHFTTPVAGNGNTFECHGGYLQLDTRTHTYVYDYDGNQIIKAYNKYISEE